MKYRIFAFLLVVALCFGLTGSAFAQEYYFNLLEETVNVYWNADGTMALDYIFVFSNDSGAHAIEFVDVGMPNSSYDMSTVIADSNGTALDVSTSDYLGTGSGFAVVMGSQTIQPGERGTVHVRVGRIERVLYDNTDKEKYASGVFSPQWFGSQYVFGFTNLTVIFHLPPGVKPEESIYYPPEGGWKGTAEPVAGFDNEGRITFTWNDPTASSSTQYKFGASFPASYVPDSAIVRTTIFDLILGGILAVIGLVGQALPFCCFAGFFFGIPIAGAISERKRKMQYMPPKISMEGHGIKRGLTAVEAAILMGQPLEKVMTMILFGVTKKGAAQVEKKDPLELALANPMPADLRGYESEFLEAFREADIRKRRKDLQTMTVNLVKSVTEKMKGFSRKETIEYYKAVNEKAWAQIAAAGTPEIQSQMFEEALEWTMLDKEYDDRARRTFTGPIYVPMWWGRYDPIYRHSTSTPMPSTASAGNFGPMGGSSGGRATLPGADFAASVVTGTQTFAQKVLGGDFTSGVTQTTNPPPPPSRSGGGGRSGGGCACACACAGCACACAGGGR